MVKQILTEVMLLKSKFIKILQKFEASRDVINNNGNEYLTKTCENLAL